MSAESLSKHRWITRHGYPPDPFLQAWSTQLAIFSLCCVIIIIIINFSGVDLGICWQGRSSPCDISGDRQRALSARGCLLSHWTHECRRAPGMVMQGMTLDLSRRGRLGQDQLQIKPCLEADTVGRPSAPCRGSSAPVISCQPWKEEGLLLEMQIYLVGRSPCSQLGPGTCRGPVLSVPGLGIAPGELQTRKLIKAAGLMLNAFESWEGFVGFVTAMTSRPSLFTGPSLQECLMHAAHPKPLSRPVIQRVIRFISSSLPFLLLASVWLTKNLVCLARVQSMKLSP